MIITVKGKVFTGLGDGKKFIELPWVKEQIREKLGFEPYPGTLNLSLSSDAQIINLLNSFRGWKILPQEGYFPGRFYKALIMRRVHGAIVKPEVPRHPEGVIEIIAPFCLREEFNLKDGEVEVKIWVE